MYEYYIDYLIVNAFVLNKPSSNHCFACSCHWYNDMTLFYNIQSSPSRDKHVHALWSIGWNYSSFSNFNFALKLGNGEAITSYALLDMWIFIHAGLKSIPFNMVKEHGMLKLWHTNNTKKVLDVLINIIHCSKYVPENRIICLLRSITLDKDRLLLWTAY